MASFATLAGSSVGKKVFVAITGLLLIGYLILHLIGNLTLFIGKHAFNAYAHFLETFFFGKFVIVFEVGLIIVFVIHMIYAVWVAWKDKEDARPVKYAMVRNAGGKSRKTLASRAMIITGPLILLFVIIHVKMFKFPAHVEVVDDVRDLYDVVVGAFQNVGIMLGYMVVMFIVGMHLWHGTWSAFQSLGWNSDRHIKILTRISVAAAIILGGGFFLLPPYVHFFVARGGH
jgi:succinate dehydrogenase / fumarate reductase cytochrome b subunit